MLLIDPSGVFALQSALAQTSLANRGQFTLVVRRECRRLEVEVLFALWAALRLSTHKQVPSQPRMVHEFIVGRERRLAGPLLIRCVKIRDLNCK